MRVPLLISPAAFFLPILLVTTACQRTATTAQQPEKGSRKLNDYWTELRRIPPAYATRPDPLPDTYYRLLRLDLTAFKQHLATATDSSGKRVLLPLGDGTDVVFIVTPSKVMSPELAARYPGIGTYKGTSVASPGTQVRLEVNAAGLKAMVNQTSSVLVIEPYQPGDTVHYISYNRARGTKSVNGSLRVPNAPEKPVSADQ